METQEILQENLIRVKERLDKANLLAVTKSVEVPIIRKLYGLGVRDFGENRANVLLEKSRIMTELGHSDIFWHFIGKVQSNKINKLLDTKGLKYIHSVDSIAVYDAIFLRMDRRETSLNFYIQMNLTGESQKQGLTNYDELAMFINNYFKFSHPKLKLYGLMAMGPIRTDNFEQDTRQCFKQLKTFRDRLESDFELHQLQLSMGMSHDFEMALEHDTNWVRIGSALFKGL